MLERDKVFRQRLLALMADLNDGLRSDRKLQQMVGAFARRLYTEAGTRNWGDLKRRADQPTYDSMLSLFMKQAEQMSKAGDTLGVRAFETLALSLIAREQTQLDLVAGVDMLDDFISRCVTVAKATNTVVVDTAPPARPN